MDQDQNHVSRRNFLRHLGLAGVVGASGSLLAACGGGSDDASGEGDGSGKGRPTASTDCSALSGLSSSQKQRRKQQIKALNYVKSSPKSNRNCANCQLYQQEKYGSGCGGCQLIPGPVAADGYCRSWAAKS